MLTYNDIPYDQIDVEVRRLVALLNRRCGIRTISSCVGHAPGDECQIALRITTLAALGDLVSALPFTGERVRWCSGRPTMQALWMTAETTDAEPLTFRLHLSGTPLYARRDLVLAVENALATGLDSGPGHGGPSESGSTPPTGGGFVTPTATLASVFLGFHLVSARKSWGPDPRYLTLALRISHPPPAYPTGNGTASQSSKRRGGLWHMELSYGVIVSNPVSIL
jgi:hypothetical protein